MLRFALLSVAVIALAITGCSQQPVYPPPYPQPQQPTYPQQPYYPQQPCPPGVYCPAGYPQAKVVASKTTLSTQIGRVYVLVSRDRYVAVVDYYTYRSVSIGTMVTANWHQVSIGDDAHDETKNYRPPDKSRWPVKTPNLAYNINNPKSGQWGCTICKKAMVGDKVHTIWHNNTPITFCCKSCWNNNSEGYRLMAFDAWIRRNDQKGYRVSKKLRDAWYVAVVSASRHRT